MDISKAVNRLMTITDFMIYISINLTIVIINYFLFYYLFIK